MFLGDAESVQRVQSRLTDAAEDVRRLRTRAGRAIDVQVAGAGPDGGVLVEAMWSRWDEVGAELRVTIAALDEAVDVLHRLAGRIDGADAEWRARSAAAQSQLDAVIAQVRSEQIHAGEPLGSLRLSSELRGRGVASFGTVDLLAGAAEVEAMTDRLASIHAELETVRGWP